WHAGFDASLGGRALPDALLAAPPALELPAAAYRALVARRASEQVETALFDARSGVWWLAPEQLHGLAFDRVFAPGLLRGAYPRAPAQDPLLDDSTRVALQARLPHLAPKAARTREEQRLWHELLAAAPRVRLSWPARDATGRPTVAAPLVRALVRAHGDPPPAPARDAQPRPARRHLLALAAGARELAVDELADAWLAAERESAELHARAAAPDARVLRARAAVQLEHGAAADAGLGPQHGWIGRQPQVARYATFYERFASCAWQAWLARELGLDAAPDPLGVLPELDAQLLGRTVHDALEAVLGARVPEATALESAAQRTLADGGVHYRGLARALAEIAAPYVRRALELSHVDGAPVVSGCEVEGRCELAGREIRFRADRVDARTEGPLLIDYKTGAAVGVDKWRRQLRRGSMLQAACYAASAPGAEGVYLYVDPEISDKSARRSTRELEGAGRPLAELAIATLGRAIDRGVCTPRPEIDGTANPACRTCAVASACSRDDTRWKMRWLVGLRLAAPAGARSEYLASAAELDALARAAAEGAP
ncbi:MAG: PD-(D/E)XK nuclease family protein, partial [Planctomycetota bacterium]